MKGDQPNVAGFLPGIEEARRLRRVEKCTDPIIFTSFLPVNFLLSQSQTSILTAVGHGYLQLPYTEEELDQVSRSLAPLNDIQLKDIIINFCQLRSPVRESFHAFKGRIREIKNREASDAEKDQAFRQAFAHYEAELRRDAGGFPEILREYKRIITHYKSDDPGSIEYIETIQEENFVSFLPSDNDEAQTGSYVQKPWEVLFLDDKPYELAALHKVLGERNIHYRIATTVAEAKKYILEDEMNKIAVVVADYRLIEADNNGWKIPRMQPEQGYDFLMWLSQQDRYTAMVALSGLSKWFLMDSFRQKQVNVKVYSKGGLLGGGARMFVDDIEDLGNKIFETLLSLPTTAVWKTQLKKYYKWLRLECTYSDKIEQWVSDQAEAIILRLDHQLQSIHNTTSKEDRYQRLNIPDPPGRSMENLPTEDEVDLEKLDLFKLRLAYRRVLIYYHIMGTIELNIVAKIFNYGSAAAKVIDNKGQESKDFEYLGGKKQVLSIQAISEGDIPFNILVEEKLWLKHKMGIQIEKAQVSINEVYELLGFYLEQAKKKIPGFDKLPAFKDAFTSGKSAAAIDKDLDHLLKQLSASNPALRDELITRLFPVLDDISLFMHPVNSYDRFAKTLNKYR